MQIVPGMKVSHSVYGEGTVTFVSPEGDHMLVAYGKAKTKQIRKVPLNARVLSK